MKGSIERVRTLINGGTPDRPPLFDLLRNDAVLSHFAGEKAYFSRTLAESGPLQSISGRSDWRPFQLPFAARDESGWLDDRPERLDLNLVLPGAGKVQLRSLRLVQYDITDDSSGPGTAEGVPRQSRNAAIR